ncbi:DUF4166 domain-containing protein [Alkalicoccus urumqiensis]|uniref:DUF4166 domain-containing protein n=1 Tax=Alkalicoccus urumqiensis TaxID=1548213 RepID=A0A2P6MGT6_ALKUR|nr:DUF4166 domain-containing protein [Alkalicoccus urumqiensis]PRO65450.1 DUF4166 domain-containing protein [Alkalicoccus urumqiensis]
MTIYQHILREDFQKLHPKLQERYTLQVGKPFYGEGTMSKIERGAAWLVPLLKLGVRWKLLFPESGNDIPFTIKNTSRILSDGEVEVYWERSFYFEKVTRNFNAFMTVDANQEFVKDYLGEPNLFYSDLKFSVTSEGNMCIRSGVQRLILRNIEIPIPSFLQADVVVEESYDEDKDTFTINVTIQNKIVGRVMAYEGEFKEQHI